MKPNVVAISDLPTVATLMYHGHSVMSIDRAHQRAAFLFMQDGELENVLNGYRERTLHVEPYAFAQCIREAKDRLYNG